MPADLLAETARFRAWADAIPPERRAGEWEVDYPTRHGLYEAVLAFAERPFGSTRERRQRPRPRPI